MTSKLDLTADDTALLIIDVQNDFCPGGQLAVQDGDQVVAPINLMITSAAHIVATQDWHPDGHASFATSHEGRRPFDAIEFSYGMQTLWPDHCIQGSDGAAFHPALDTARAAAIIRKGMNPAVDSYSAFFENDKKTQTGLAGYLRDIGCKQLTVAGLATDFCVAWSALDGVSEGFEVKVQLASCRGINFNGSLDAALENMRNCGVKLV